MYRCVTRQVQVEVQVTVTPCYLEAESSPAKGRYVWAYTIEIVNLGAQAVQLKSRYWQIRDANGQLEEVRGEGVIGQQPRLQPGERFEYTSGCPLGTPHGLMEGSYGMETDDGRTITVAIPPFSLDSPDLRRVVH